MTEPLDSDQSSLRWIEKAGPLTHVAIFLVILATSWYMLKELAVLLRPLLLAVLVVYLIVPVPRQFPTGKATMRLIVALLTVSLLVVVVLALVIYGSILQFNDQLPHLTQRARELTSDFKDFVENNAPELRSLAGDLVKIETQGESRISEIAAQLLTIAANVIIEAIIVGLYVIFLLIEGHRMQCRVQKGFSNERANEILAVVQRISVGITQYMRAKVKTSLILAIPVGIILQIFNVKFALAFALLTFGCNFVPYVGSAIAFSVPTLFAFLDLPFGWKPFAVAGGLVCCHIGTASFVEPQVIGKAVGLSPLVVLISLTFWGLCWGIVGMFLAVPLTVTMVIIMENLEATRPMAQLLGDG